MPRRKKSSHGGRRPGAGPKFKAPEERVASKVIGVRLRLDEIARLKKLGATPGQAIRAILIERGVIDPDE
jgi:hypothetical protein